MTFGQWLRRQMMKQEGGMSQAELARKVGTSAGLVSDWIRDVRVPSSESCDKIADALGLDIDEVLVRAGHRPPLGGNDSPLLRELSAVVRGLPPNQQEEVLWYARARRDRMAARRRNVGSLVP